MTHTIRLQLLETNKSQLSENHQSLKAPVNVGFYDLVGVHTLNLAFIISAAYSCTPGPVFQSVW